ncbi:hypothetical protein BDM02DRAFT_3111616 [Thelephora ganbajun]|uniref:Uncharacterized protein n=1 Tax=Thelephora ganbajun TaxID=370292 RepID=A0ACB6ZMH7_THEGA|nr:hypothetical protein BDM02DRAFT_3111616 [Thelephora ganbajun]
MTRQRTPYLLPGTLHPHFVLAIFSNFTVVVTNFADGKQLFRECPYTTPGEIPNKFSEALKALHANNLVFGDLIPNILVTDQHHVRLVDFDWCGRAREGEYPTRTNLVDIEWPKRVAPGCLLRFEYDNEMLRRLSWRK